MNKILPVIGLFLLFTHPVFADYQSAYSDYTFAYSQYRTSYNDYQVAKSTYLTYHTLVSQNEAINKLRAILQARDQVMLVYYNLLQEKLNATPGVTDSAKNTFGKVKASEITWLAGHQKKVSAAASLEDLNQAASDFENHFPQMAAETKQTIGVVFAGKESTLKSQVDSFITNLTTKLTEIRQTGENTTFADRGQINVKNKLDLYQQKLTEANSLFSHPDNGLFEGQQKFAEANQYLREAASFLTEIIKSITG